MPQACGRPYGRIGIGIAFRQMRRRTMLAGAISERLAAVNRNCSLTLGGADTVALLIAKDRRSALLLGRAGAIALRVTKDRSFALLLGGTNPITIVVSVYRWLRGGYVHRDHQNANCDKTPDHFGLISVPWGWRRPRL
jgi:hypothetical protein